MRKNYTLLCTGLAIASACLFSGLAHGQVRTFTNQRNGWQLHMQGRMGGERWSASADTLYLTTSRGLFAYNVNTQTHVHKTSDTSLAPYTGGIRGQYQVALRGGRGYLQGAANYYTANGGRTFGRLPAGVVVPGRLYPTDSGFYADGGAGFFQPAGQPGTPFINTVRFNRSSTEVASLGNRIAVGLTGEMVVSYNGGRTFRTFNTNFGLGFYSKLAWADSNTIYGLDQDSLYTYRLANGVLTSGRTRLVNPGSTRITVQTMAWASATFGVITFDMGRAAITTDGGLTFRYTSAPRSISPQGYVAGGRIFLANQSYLYEATREGTLVQVMVEFPNIEDYRDVHIANQVGMMASANVLLITRNGGNTWTLPDSTPAIYQGTGYQLVYVIGDSIMLMAQGGHADRSVDFGRTWRSIVIPVEPVSVTENGRGYVSISGRDAAPVIYKNGTRDLSPGGSLENGTRVMRADTLSLVIDRSIFTGALSSQAQSLNFRRFYPLASAIFQASGLMGMASSQTDTAVSYLLSRTSQPQENKLHRTTDAGRTWQQLPYFAPTTENVFGVQDLRTMGADTILCLLRRNIHISIDKGLTWDTLPPPSQPSIITGVNTPYKAHFVTNGLFRWAGHYYNRLRPSLITATRPGIATGGSTPQIILWPNPSTAGQALQLKLLSAGGTSLALHRASLYAITGALVYSGPAPQGQLPTTGIAPGLYTVQLQAIDGTQATTRVIIK